MARTTENVLTRDEMLEDIMRYWLPNAAATLARLYWETFNKFTKILEGGKVSWRICAPIGGSCV
jgi:hypothetical protein